MSDYDYEYKGRIDVYEKKPKKDDNSCFIIIVVVILGLILIFTILKFVGWPWWYPLAEWFKLLGAISKETSKFTAFIIWLFSFIPGAFFSMFVLTADSKSAWGKFLIWAIGLLILVWVSYASACLLNLIFGIV